MDGCPLCGNKNATSSFNLLMSGGTYLCNCPCCGKFVIFESEKWNSFAASYLLYDKVVNHNEDKFRIIGRKERYDAITNPKNAFLSRTDSIFVSLDTIVQWEPKSFQERIEKILLIMVGLTPYPGKSISLDLQFPLFLCANDKSDHSDEINFLIDYMERQEYICIHVNEYRVLPKGYSLVEKTLRETRAGKQCFIAMSFAPELDSANDSIQAAITANGYIPRRMDEYAHNNQIVPEMLFQIRQSKFVIADLTNHNNGAYYEAGYAAALGKPVILTCKKDSFDADSHFDVKQQATIVWEDEEELEKRLTSWIEATVGKAE